MYSKLMHSASIPTLPATLRDPTDEKVLALAIGAEGDYLVTGDEDLLSAQSNRGCRGPQIIRPTTFLALLKTTKQAEGRGRSRRVA